MAGGFVCIDRLGNDFVRYSDCQRALEASPLTLPQRVSQGCNGGGKGFWGDLADGAESVSDWTTAGSLTAAGIGLVLAPTGAGFAGAEIAAGVLGGVSVIASGVAAGANFVAGNSGRGWINAIGAVSGGAAGRFAERGAAAVLGRGRMFGDVSASQTRRAAYAGGFVGGFSGDAAKGAAAGVCNIVSGGH